jgi:hypothetical protein
LRPIRPGSWHVPTTAFTDPLVLEPVLAAILQASGGVEALADPETSPALNGGLALRCAGDVLVEPTCCSDLGNASDWKEAAVYRGWDWRMVWIGHPWISVCCREPWLILSSQHESADPKEGWAVRPEELGGALAAAEGELERFARQIAAVLPSMGYSDDPLPMARRMAGLLA